MGNARLAQAIRTGFVLVRFCNQVPTTPIIVRRILRIVCEPDALVLGTDP